MLSVVGCCWLLVVDDWLVGWLLLVIVIRWLVGWLVGWLLCVSYGGFNKETIDRDVSRCRIPLVAVQALKAVNVPRDKGGRKRKSSKRGNLRPPCSNPSCEEAGKLVALLSLSHKARELINILYTV